MMKRNLNNYFNIFNKNNFQEKKTKIQKINNFKNKNMSIIKKNQKFKNKKYQLNKKKILK